MVNWLSCFGGLLFGLNFESSGQFFFNSFFPPYHLYLPFKKYVLSSTKIIVFSQVAEHGRNSHVLAGEHVACSSCSYGINLGPVSFFSRPYHLAHTTGSKASKHCARSDCWSLLPTSLLSRPAVTIRAFYLIQVCLPLLDLGVQQGPVLEVCARTREADIAPRMTWILAVTKFMSQKWDLKWNHLRFLRDISWRKRLASKSRVGWDNGRGKARDSLEGRGPVLGKSELLCLHSWQSSFLSYSEALRWFLSHNHLCKICDKTGSQLWAMDNEQHVSQVGSLHP